MDIRIDQQGERITKLEERLDATEAKLEKVKLEVKYLLEFIMAITIAQAEVIGMDAFGVSLLKSQCEKAVDAFKERMGE